jgi:uncharacterized protein (UPF0276 family)
MCPLPRLGAPDLGVGVGLRVPHYSAILAERPAVGWFECISENFLVAGGKPLFYLDAVRDTYPVILHGVSLNLGGPDPLDRAYLRRLRALVDRVKPPWASDHLCWNGAQGVHLHDLLPLPMTDEAVRHVATRVREVQDALGIPFAVENVSSYMTYRADAMPEWEFVAAVAEAAGCGLLLDVNNVFVSSQNHGFDPERYIDAIPAERVLQMHLAGHTDKGKYLLDSHSGHIREEVWALYRRACRRVGPCATLIEWDDEIPELPVLLAEADRARRERDDALASLAEAP